MTYLLRYFHNYTHSYSAPCHQNLARARLPCSLNSSHYSINFVKVAKPLCDSTGELTQPAYILHDYITPAPFSVTQ